MVAQGPEAVALVRRPNTWMSGTKRLPPARWPERSSGRVSAVLSNDACSPGARHGVGSPSPSSFAVPVPNGPGKYWPVRPHSPDTS